MSHSSTQSTIPHLDSSERYDELRAILKRKLSLRYLYKESYLRFRECLKDCPKEGIVLEIGSGAGFAKEIIPELITSDVIPYSGLDKVVDATSLPFADKSLRAILMYNVLHHIPDAESCFREVSRCLMPGGRLFLVDPYPGWLHKPIMKYVHHEGYDDSTKEWRFQSEGPLSSANGALAWILFYRDLEKFKKMFPDLQIKLNRKHSPLRYWLCGGLKSWNLVPAFLFPAVTMLDETLSKLLPETASFLEIQIVRK